ncbi:MAG TPA: tetratricopeptide repeat protein [Bryobacteraceae bacterium]|nr:tetratricopeptide repeat protein [Bryobacteraceae bacterium]
MFLRASLILFIAVAWADDDVPTLIKTADASYMRGDYDAAFQSLETAWEQVQQNTETSDPIRYDILKRLTSVRAAAGQFAEADAFLQLAINWREVAVNRNDPQIAEDLVQSANLCRGMKDYDRALAILQRAMSMHTQAQGMNSSAVADDFARMAQIYVDEKKPDDAAHALITAVDVRTKATNALHPSLLPSLDRLGEILITLADYPKAEETFRHALVIRETMNGKEHPDLLGSIDGLAYSLFGQKKYDEAEPLYNRLLALWMKSVGGNHPMVAMTLEKIAVFYAAQKRYDEAKAAAEQGNAIRAHFLAEGLTHEATEQLAEEKKDDALTLYRRTLSVLDPPNPVYDQMRADTDKIVQTLEPPPAPVKKTAPRKKTN